MKLWALLAASLLLCCTLVAQECDEESRGPDGGTRVRVEGIQVLPATGKPFSGRSSTEWRRTLEDGTVVSTHLFAMVARAASIGSVVTLFQQIRTSNPR